MFLLRAYRQRLELVLTFVVGIVWGVCLSSLLHLRNFEFKHSGNETDVLPTHRWTISTSSPLLNLSLSEALISGYNNRSSVAAQLYNETRVLCMIITQPSNHQKRAIHVKRTWGRRCNKLIFISSKQDDVLDTVKVDAKEGRSNLWAKTREGFRYVYENHFNDADWFIKADDDTYVIMENLRAFLYPYSTKAAVYFGSKFHAFQKYATKGYMSGGAGYVLSKASLHRFVSIAYLNATICSKLSFGAEDREMGRCLENIGVTAGDSRDQNNLARFFPLSPLHSFAWTYQSTWYRKYVFYNIDSGKHDCCSHFAVSFHYIEPKDLYILEFFIYQLRPFGIHQIDQAIPEKANMLPLLEKWRKEKTDNAQVKG